MTPEDTPRMAERTDRQAQHKFGAAPDLCGPHCLPRYATEGEIDSLRGTRDSLKEQLRERDAQIASLTAERDRLRTTLEQIASCNELSPFPGFARS